MAGGTGAKFASATTIVAGVASLVATLLSIVSIWFQTKNYRKPLLQRYVSRILLMVPIYSISSWLSMVSLTAAAWFDPIRDIYEAFTIYTFFQLLINYMGGERALIDLMHGREPVHHLWPLANTLERVDISDPHTFLAIKRGILQYAFLKPILAFTAVIMKATGTYQEGYIGVSSGYFWSGIIYNISVTVSLYSLGLFWVCMHNDLKPFRPVPKFLCIKLIIFASYWQGFFLSILVWLGAIPDNVEGYTPDNLAAAIQDALICIEMPAFAIAHWYAFSWTDYADNKVTQGRMPIYYALRDSFGIVDLIEDSKETFSGDTYQYRAFDSGDKVIAHEASRQRLARLKDGMRYERGGKGKYWIPKPGEASTTTPLLGSTNGRPSHRADLSLDIPDEPYIDADEDAMYEDARKLEYGDWNYPVISCQHLPESVLPPTIPIYQRRPTSLAVSREDVAQALAESRGSSPVQSPRVATVTSKKKGKGKHKSSLKQSSTSGTSAAGVGGESKGEPGGMGATTSLTAQDHPRVHFTPPSMGTPDMEETGAAWGGGTTTQTTATSTTRREGDEARYVIGDDEDEEFGNNVWGR